jgi:hypothetical protein
MIPTHAFNKAYTEVMIREKDALRSFIRYLYRAQIRRVKVVPMINDIPPIVGVPDFDICQLGPSVYIGCSALFLRIGMMSLDTNTVSVSEKRKAMA